MNGNKDLTEMLYSLLEGITESYSTGCCASESEQSSQTKEIPLGISNRHVHLSRKDVEALFGAGYQLQKLKDLSQPGQFACKETVTVCGPKGVIEKVRILGPERSDTQIEILKSDCFKLGVKAPVKMSGEIDGTPGATLIGPKGSVILDKGVIVAQRHIHMTPQDAVYFGVSNGDVVDIAFDGLRGGVYKNVAIRTNPNFALDCHLDMEEANAMELTSSSKINIIK